MWSIFIFLVCAMTAGIAIDGSNALRAKEHLQVTADIAAHAGLVELTKGGDRAAIESAVSDSVESNLPRGIFGGTLGDPSGSVTIGHYSDGQVDTSGASDENAVGVELSFSDSLGSEVRTLVLGVFGFESWNVEAMSVAAMDEFNECAGNDGIYAAGEIKMTSHADIGPGFCIYSKDLVEMSNHNNFQPGARVGMRDLDDCSKCTDAHNPGVEDARFEANLDLESAAVLIERVMTSLLDTSGDTEPADEFLKEVYLDGDLTPLSDLGYQTNKISKGTIISISGGDFESMDFVPTGLIYAVYCSSPLDANGALSPKETGSGSSKGKKSGGSGGGSVKTLSLETGSGSAISDVAIVTDCELDFGRTAEIQNSIVATSSTSNKSVSANSKARIGSASQVCPSEEKVVIMTMGDLSVPAAMETNNVDFYIAGDAHIASGTSSQAMRLGTTIYVDGEIHISAQGTWHACGDAPDSLTPTIESIRHVIAALN